MVNGVLLLPVVNLPGSIGERGGRRREIVAGKNGEGGREREREGKWKRSGRSLRTTVFHGVANSYRP